MKQPYSPLKTVLFLRLLGLLVFPAGVVLSALLQRSALMVVVLAAGMLIASWVERLRLLRMAGNDKRPDFAVILPGLVWRAGLLAGLFIISVGFLALFRETSLSRGLGLADLLLFLGTTGIAIGANFISSSIAAREMEGALAEVNAAFGTGGANDNAGHGEVIEGEIIDRE